MIKNIAQIKNISEKNIFWFLVICLLFLMASYSYLIVGTTLNIITRKSIEQKTITLDSQISELEFEYISLKNNINLDLAKEIGYKEVLDVRFVSKKAGPSLSLVKIVK